MEYKQAFLMLKNIYACWETLSDVQAGKLWKSTAMYQYESYDPDQIVERLELDSTTHAIFLVMVSQFRNEEVNYMTKSQKRSRAGKAGAEARWGKDNAVTSAV